jgi:hypothetical protein
MNQCVLRQRHFTVLDDRSYVCQELLPLLKCVLLPLGEVHVIASTAHVSLHQPGHRGDVAIPRPSCLARVAVHTRALKNRRDFRWKLQTIDAGLMTLELFWCTEWVNRDRADRDQTGQSWDGHPTVP